MAAIGFALFVLVTLFIIKPNINSCIAHQNYNNADNETTSSRENEGRTGPDTTSKPEDPVLSRQDVLTKSDPAANPYAVMILGFRDDVHVHNPMVCSGSLVNAEYILTAGHCIHVIDFINKVEYDNLHHLIFAGGQNIKQLESGVFPNGAQALWATHQYSMLRRKKAGSPYDYDIGMLKVGDGGFTYNRVVENLGLATTPWYKNHYRYCIVTGFGVVQHGEKNELDDTRKTQQVELIDIENEVPCNKSVFNFVGYDSPRKWLMVSKPKENHGLCNGDSGAALVCNGEIRGVASYFVYKDLKTCLPMPGATKCATKNNLVVFLDVCKFYVYILGVSNQNNFLSIIDSTHPCWNDQILSLIRRPKIQDG